MSFLVLFACTANICRSPMAERLLRARLEPGIPVVAASAGTSGLEGRSMDEASARALRDLGGDPRGHVAQWLTLPLVSEADLILTAGYAHRSAVVQADPMAFRRAFTIREFARLGADLGPVPAVTQPDLQTRVAIVASQRGLAEPPEPGADEIDDPFGAPWLEVEACARQVSGGVDGVIAALGLPRAPRGR